MPRGVTKRRPATVAALLEAALDLFAERGYGATSIPDICKEAGLTKGAFYSNFANKEALFLALLDANWGAQSARIRAALPSGRISEVIARRARLPRLDLDRRWTLVSTEFSLHAIRHPEVAALLVEHEAAARGELAALIGESLRQADRRPTIGLGELARMVVAGIEGCDIQALTDASAGARVRTEMAGRVVVALLRQFSEPLATGPDSAPSLSAGAVTP